MVSPSDFRPFSVQIVFAPTAAYPTDYNSLTGFRKVLYRTLVTSFLQSQTAATTLIINADFGARITQPEMAISSQFLPTKDDPPTTVMNKINGAIGLFNYENDKVIAQQTGQPLNPLTDYLTAAGYTGQ